MPGRVLIGMQNSVVRVLLWISRLLSLSVSRWLISAFLPTSQKYPILCEQKYFRHQLDGRATCISMLVSFMPLAKHQVSCHHFNLQVSLAGDPAS